MTNSLIGILPRELIARWTKNADNRRASWLADMLDLRDFLDEYSGEKRDVYEEAADAFGLDCGTLQNKMSILRNYTPAQLTRWLIVKKLSLDAINTVNRACANGDIKMSPADYIENVLLNGDGEGNTPTKKQVDVLIAEGTGRPQEYWVNVYGSKFASRFGILNVSGFLIELRGLVEKWKISTL